MASFANSTLAKARYFADQADQIGVSDLVHFSHNLEAAIVFGRSVVHHLTAECGQVFTPWLQTQPFWTDPVNTFFRDKRNYLIHNVGPVGVHTVISVIISVPTAAAIGQAHPPRVIAEPQVVRGKPWYRRRPEILWEDARDKILRPLRAWRLRRQIRRWRAARERAAGTAHLSHTEDIRFTDPARSQRPATDELRAYFQLLEQLIDDAENQFGL